MATEFTVFVEDRPGALAHLTEVLVKNAVNILAIHGSPCTDQGVIQFVPDSPDAAIEALQQAGFDYVTQNVLMVRLREEPGALAHLARAMGEAGVNINAIYVAMSGQLVLDVDNHSKAQQVAMSLGVR